MDFSAPNTPITSQHLQSSPTQMQHTIDDNQLTRVTSHRSEASSYSASTASFTSFSSSSTSGRRAIVPLYNLQAHNVMTNMVVDAGTDAKIAKFQKRGIEFLGLAVLDPVEVWPKSRTGGDGYQQQQERPRGTVYLSGGDGFLSPTGHAKGLTTPERLSVSSLSTTSADHHQQQLQQQRLAVTPTTPGSGGNQTPMPSPTPTPTASSKKISFGKLFGSSKKKDSSSNSHSRTPSLLDSSPLGSLAPPRTSFAKRLSASLSSPPPPPSPQHHASTHHLPRTPTHTTTVLPDTDSPLQYQQTQAQETMTMTMNVGTGKLRPPVLGVQAAFSSPVHPPIGRPYKYVWVVRRWIKGGEGGLLSGVKGRLGAVTGGGGNGGGIGGNGGGGDGFLIEVRFEWAKSNKDKDKEKGKRKEKSPGAATGGDGSDGRSRSTSRRGSPSTPPEGSSAAGEEEEEERGIRKTRSSRRLAKRRSVISHHSISTVADTEDGHGRADDGDESDPEDSETPWNCTLRLTPRQHVGAMPPPAKLKVATLTPSPHHPKVLGVLKIPFPLPDVEVEAMAFRPRMLPLLQPALPETPGALMLTAEEIKDIVSTTAMWLIVREGFGGLGKVARKGDGWLIRS
jgi:hypothetical protein